MYDSILLKSLTLVLPHGIYEGDVYIEKGKISDIAPSISKSADLVIQEQGLTLLPGCIDPHVHFRDPGATHKEDLYTGSKAAVSGGVTSFFDMPNTSPSATNRQTVEEKKQRASQVSLANYNFFIGATNTNLNELNSIENVPGIKIYVGSSTGSLLVNETDILDQLFQQSSKLIAVHSEDEAMIQENLKKYADSKNVTDHMHIRSAQGALICTKKLAELALKHDTRLHICHLTTTDEVDYLKQTQCVSFNLY